MSKRDFIPVILGTDTNMYGMAKSFHMQYGIKSVVVGKASLFSAKDSNIIEVKLFDKFDTQEVFLKTLVGVAKELSKEAEKLILIASSDNYAELIVNNKHELEKYYCVPYISRDMMERLIDKESFYKVCEEYGLDYPKTYICTKETKNNLDLPFNYPIVVKPADSVLYFETHFEGKKKAYIIESEEEYKNVVNTIYSTQYDKNLIVQEYIPGDDTSMRVLNCYVDKDSKVSMMCLGKVLLEDCTPTLIGNYVAIQNDYNEEIFEKYKVFLEKLGYRGFANFDMKYDKRDNKYKVFEINIRQGRSSFFVTGCGNNLAKYLVEDLVYGKNLPTEIANKEHLWLGVPKKLILKYLDDSKLKEDVNRLIRENKYSFTLYYDKDSNLKRKLRVFSYYRGYNKTYKIHFKKKN